MIKQQLIPDDIVYFNCRRITYSPYTISQHKGLAVYIGDRYHNTPKTYLKIIYVIQSRRNLFKILETYCFNTPKELLPSPTIRFVKPNATQQIFQVFLLHKKYPLTITKNALQRLLNNYPSLTP